MHPSEQPVRPITPEEFESMENFFEQKEVKRLSGFFGVISPNTTKASEAIIEGDYDLTKLILNDQEYEEMVTLIKDRPNGILHNISKYKRLLEKADYVGNLELRLKMERLEDLECCCKSIRTILHIKYFTKKGDEKAVLKLSEDLHNSYERMYGRVTEQWVKKILNYTINKKLYKNCKSNNPELWEKIKSKIETYVDPDLKIEFPKTSEFKELEDIFITEQLDLFCPEALIEITDPTEMVTPEFMLEQVGVAIDNIYKNLEIPSTEKKWKARLRFEDPEKANFSTEGSNNEVVVPMKPREIGKFKGVLYHEVFIHMLRIINAKRFSLESSFPDWEVFEEGLASVVEMIRAGKEKILVGSSIGPSLIALSQTGLSLEEILELYKASEMTPENNTSFKNSLIRILRGSTGMQLASGKNCIYTKDKAYSNGVEKVYYLVQTLNDEHTNLELKNAIKKVFANVGICNFDPLNQLHIRYLINKGRFQFTPSELDNYLRFISD